MRELIAANVVAPGDVDERDIKLVQPEDLRGYRQCHFFAGIAVWSYALRLAGWPDDREVWTGSCPCPSFSSAGKGQGFDDARHLWPDWIRLIRKCKPPVVFGEQADDAIGYGWLDLVQAQMEAENYALGKAILASASVGGADLRERLYFVGDRLDDSDNRGREIRRAESLAGMGEREERRVAGANISAEAAQSSHCYGRMGEPIRSGLEGLAGNGDNGHESGRIGENAPRSVGAAGEPCGLADSESDRCGKERSRGGRITAGDRTQRNGSGLVPSSADGGMADTNGGESGNGDLQPGGEHGLIAPDRGAGGLADAEHDGRDRPQGTETIAHRDEPRLGLSDGDRAESRHPFADALKGHWRDADWLFCTDGRWRPVEPGTFPLAHGAPARLGRLRGYGDAINAEVAKAFIESYCEARGR